ncbi:MAG: site-2 protease family protein [Oxalobacter sp.]|nr:site-2 protease family protein [Oxalobacter sp.]
MDFQLQSVESLLETILVWAIPLLTAITLHEAAHGYTAYRLGDATAYLQGRVSLNPIRHIDLLGTIIIPLVLLATGSSFIFGYAKPVPVNFSQLRHVRRDTILVALAGPFSNLVMAFIWSLLKLTLLLSMPGNVFLLKMVNAGIVVNLVLFAFNLFPLPPMDGGRIMLSLLPPQMAYQFAKVERYGFFILMGLIYLGVTSYWMRPVMMIGRWVINLFIYPLLYFLGLS